MKKILIALSLTFALGFSHSISATKTTSARRQALLSEASKAVSTVLLLSFGCVAFGKAIGTATKMIVQETTQETRKTPEKKAQEAKIDAEKSMVKAFVAMIPTMFAFTLSTARTAFAA